MNYFVDITDEDLKKKFLEADIEICNIFNEKKFTTLQGVSLLIQIAMSVTWEHSPVPEIALKTISDAFNSEIELKRFKGEKND